MRDLEPEELAQVYGGVGNAKVDEKNKTHDNKQERSSSRDYELPVG